MNGFIKFVSTRISPIATKFSTNTWVASLQDAIVLSIPLTLVGSIITIFSIVSEYIDGLPDVSPISQFSFGIIALIVAFAFPYSVLQRKRIDNKKVLAGFTSLAVFFMLCAPTYTDDEGMTLLIDNLGANGMFLGMISGIMVALIFCGLEKVSFFGKKTLIPDYIVASFDSFIPILVSLTCSWLIIYVAEINFVGLLGAILSPLTSFGQSYLGLLAYIFITAVLYSFGLSPWILYGLFYPIQLSGITANMDLVAQGLAATNIHTGEVIGAFINIGGFGCTLPLALMMLKAKSEKLSAIGKVVLIPSILNINEPLVFGAPIMLNPLLMIPFWLNSFLIPTLTYIVLKLGFVTIPAKVFNLWFLPAPFQAFLVNNDIRSLVLLAVVFMVGAAIWYPFFKVYDQQLVEQEKLEVNK